MAAGCQVDERRCTTSSGRLLDCNPCESSHFIAQGIDSPAHNAAIDEYQGQALWSGLPEHLLDNWVFGKCAGVLGEIEPFNSNSLRLEPIDIRRESRQHRIHFGTADAGRAAHRGIENL